MRKIKKSTNAGLGQILENRIFNVKEFPIAGKAKKSIFTLECTTVFEWKQNSKVL